MGHRAAMGDRYNLNLEDPLIYLRKLWWFARELGMLEVDWVPLRKLEALRTLEEV